MTKSRTRRLISGVLSLLALATASHCQAAGIVISEIMYHPASTNVLEEWVEIHNPGINATNVSGWIFSNGLKFTFPTNTTVSAGGYLVVPADLTTFTTQHPGVLNVVPASAGPLEGHTLTLVDNLGHTVNSVSYYSEGDWAARFLSTNGFTLYGHMGWEWYAPHDGGGSSLELINAAQPNSYAHNWNASAVPGGTPGQANSVASTNTAPFISGIKHSPLVPDAGDVVTVTARLVDERTNGISATVFYRNANTATPPAFTSTPMFDDGAHGDGLAGDGIFSAILPAQPDGTIVEFYLQASDLDGNVRIYPNVIPPAGSTRTANLLYQVDSEIYGGAQPEYRVIMTEMERAELYAIGRTCPDSDSDAQMNATWISTDGVVSDGTTVQLRYNVGVRNRGHGSRRSNPNNYHVNIPDDREWKKQRGINLNSQFAQTQVLGSAVFRRLGLVAADSRAVQVRVNGTNIMALPGLPNNNSHGSYAANEQYNNDLFKRSFPLDPAGNAYRGIRDQILCISASNSVADLTWHGADFTVPVYANAYFKENNVVENDFSDLIDLIAVLNSVNGHDASNYVADVQNRINVDEWMAYMAANTLLDNNETCLANGAGDDYALYRGVNDPRFLVLPYDQDDLLGNGLTTTPAGHSIWRMTSLSAMDRFMKTPEFAPIYFRSLKTLAETAFSPAQMNPLIDQVMKDFVPEANIANFKAFNAAQVALVLAQIPQSLTVSNSLATQSGYPRTTVPVVALRGTANAIDTRTVLVAGVTSSWTAWRGTWTNNNVTLTPGINRILVQTLGTNGTEIARTNVDIWYDDGSVVPVSGTIAANTTWTAAGGPYQITSTLTVANGATLTIQPGTTVYLGSGVNLVVANGGKILAEGTAAAPIRFTVAPGSGVSWGGVTIDGAVGSPESRFAYATFQGNGTTCIEVAAGTVTLDHCDFLTTTHQYLALDGASFLVTGCTFPSATTAFELVHGVSGIKAGGRGIIRDCFFGQTIGYNDVMDFTGGNRNFGQPIIQYYNNVFIGASDDTLDLDGTDAWIEGNIFLHVHKNGASDSSSAVSGGNNGSDTSEITIIGNFFYDCDQAATAKQSNFYTMLNNTIVHTTKTGGTDVEAGVINVRDVIPSPPTTFGAGFYLEGNIIVDAEQLVRNYDGTQTTVTFNNNILSAPWTGPGSGNSTNDPLLNYIPQLSETTNITTWDQAQIFRQWFALRPGSPARSTGPNGSDKGGVLPFGAFLTGGPIGTNNQTTATLTAGYVRSGNGIPVGGFPNGSGYTHYRWRLDGGVWSAETPIATAITLNGLSQGSHYVEITGKRDSGTYQDDPELGDDATITRSRTWVVDSNYVAPATPTVRINEVLAKNSGSFTNSGTTPDLIELFNYGVSAVDLSGMGLTDSTNTPFKYIFPNGTSLAPGAFLLLCADSASGGSLAHTGFGLKETGDDVSLYDKAANGGALLDQIVFGPQIADYSVGRLGDGTLGLCQPTPGTANIAQLTGSIWSLKINEWLADAQFVGANDFVELYNADPLPVALQNLFLSNAAGAPNRNEIAPLSFIAGHGLTTFMADSDENQGPNHLNFKLSPEVGMILLSAPDLRPIDVVSYGSQQTDVSQGRTPNGGSVITSFPIPTPGGVNPDTQGTVSYLVTNVTLNLMQFTQPWKFNQTSNLNGIAWVATNYNDSAWQGPGQGLLAFENNSLITPLIHTTLVAPNTKSPAGSAYYFRTTLLINTNLAGFTITANARIDDGALIYVNGVEIPTRIRMAAGSISYSDFATSLPVDSSGDAVLDDLINIPVSYFVQGTNTIAAEVHQANSGSSDIVWGMTLQAVQSFTNFNVANPMPVVLNEILGHNVAFTNDDGSVSDWIELYNPSTNTVDLAGTCLTDNPSVRKFVFGAGSLIPPTGFRLIYCDATRPVSSTNTGFSLEAKGSRVYFFDSLARGGGLLDAVSYGLQIPDYSIGRVPTGTGLWNLNLPTPAVLNSPAALASVASLKVNEWMADPASGSDWIELYNSAEQPVALGGLFLSDDLNNHFQSAISPLSFIGTGANAFRQFFADSSEGSDHANFSLKKSGEAVGIFSPGGILLDGITFGAQTTGVSQGRFPDGGSNIVSFATTSTPEESNYLPLPNSLIDEVLTHTDPPLEDAIELYNPDAAPLDISGWWLSDAKNDLRKFHVPQNTVIAPHGYVVFYEYQFNPSPELPGSFSFNSARGDSLWLSAADANGQLNGYRDHVSYGPQFNGVSFGRVPTSVGSDFAAQTALTFGTDVTGGSPTNQLTVFRTGLGAPNAGPRVGPIIISEIMYHPLPLGTNDNVRDEFVELYNLTSTNVPLYDPVHSTNGWQLRGGIDFDFNTSHSLAPGGFLLLVSFDPATNAAAVSAFRAAYGTNGTLVGPYTGKLDNGSEAVELFAPDNPQTSGPDLGLVPYVLIDRVVYGDTAPWPVDADGLGASLQRVTLSAYGNDPTNWFAGGPSAGFAAGDDSDGDGMPNDWEDAHGLNKLVNDAGLDPDHDGFTNGQEYLAGTDPQNGASVLRLISATRTGSGTDLRFEAVAGKSYSVLYRDTLTTGAWQTVADVSPQGTTQIVTVHDPANSAASRFYRVVTPAMP